MKDPKRYTCDIVSTEAGHLPLLMESDGTGAAAGCFVSWDDYEKLKSRLASVEAILKVCFSKQPLKITHYTKGRND